MMGHPTQAVCVLSERILERELEACRDDPARGFAAAFARLERVTSGLVGTDGHGALMVRARLVSARRHVWLPVLTHALSSRFPTDGWAEVIAREGEVAAKACALTLLASTLQLLSEFVGDKLTARLIRRAWSLAANAPA